MVVSRDIQKVHRGVAYEKGGAEVEKLLGDNKVNALVNGLSLNEGMSYGENFNEVERFQSNRSNNLDQLDPKAI